MNNSAVIFYDVALKCLFCKFAPSYTHIKIYRQVYAFTDSTEELFQDFHQLKSTVVTMGGS